MKINNKISLRNLYLQIIKKIVNLLIEKDSEVVRVFERNNVGL
jgi:hypothetical protein